MAVVHSKETIAEILKLRREGLSIRKISAETGVPYATVQWWRAKFIEEGLLDEEVRQRVDLDEVAMLADKE